MEGPPFGAVRVLPRLKALEDDDPAALDELRDPALEVVKALRDERSFDRPRLRRGQREFLELVGVNLTASVLSIVLGDKVDVSTE